MFSAPDELLWLEQLIHPYVRAQFDEALGRLNDEPTVVLMIPLLFEANLTGLCSEVWVVHCHPEQQLQRLQQRNHLDKDEALARIQTQWPIGRKIALSDTAINNCGTLKNTQQQVEEALENF